jgi:hypothetical protein
MDQPTIPISPETTPTIVLDPHPSTAPATPPRSATRRAALAVGVGVAAVSLLAGGVALGAAARPTPAETLSLEAQAAQADSVADAVDTLGLTESLATVGDGGTEPAGVAAILEEVIVRLEAAAAAGPQNAVTQGLSDLASALRGVQRAVESVPTDGDPTAWTALLPLVLTLLQDALGDSA